MKITKEHLHYIYTDNNKSNRDKLSTLCDNFGVKCLNDEGFKFIEIYSCDGGFSDDFELLDTDNPESTSRFVSSDDIDEMLRAAALEEKKPRTKVEYVRCEYGDKVSNIVMDFENDAPLYKMVNDEYWAIDELDDLFSIILDGGEHIYRRTETPMTEREAFIEAAIHELKSGMSDIDYAKSLFDSGKFKLVN